MGGNFRGKKLLIGGALGCVALVWALATDTSPGDTAPVPAASQPAAMQQAPMQPVPMQPAPMAGNDMSAGQQAGYQPEAGNAQQMLAALTQIRQQQCQSGNPLACQVLPEMSGYHQQLGQWEQQCRSGDRRACDAHRDMARRISTAYAESAAVMQQGAADMAQMDAWRAQMNRNAANSMANLQARGAAGQAAHAARQESYAAMNRGWESGQASSERTQGRFVDGIYGGTTMDGGGVQSRIPYGSRGYTDGHGNVVAVPDGGQPPQGWQPMDPTYAVPQ